MGLIQLQLKFNGIFFWTWKSDSKMDVKEYAGESSKELWESRRGGGGRDFLWNSNIYYSCNN